jgi:Circadian oscillating protein COP23
MKLITSQISQICLATIVTIVMPQLSIAQAPPVVDEPSSAPELPTRFPGSTAAVSRLKVSCQSLQTVVQKEDRQAVMMTWKTNYFGDKYNNAKRCQIVSERLQKAADLNNGTFQDLNLASGTLRSQTVICTLKDPSQACDDNNILFTLKPENARNPKAVIEKIANFAREGTPGPDESGGRFPSIDLNLGHWERKALGVSRTPIIKIKRPSGGF